MSLQISPKANSPFQVAFESNEVHAGKANGYPFSRPSFSTSKLTFGLLSSATSLVAMSLFMTLSAAPVYSLSNAPQPLFEPSLSQGSSNSFVDRLQCPMPLESKQICNIRPDQTCPIVEEIKRFVYLQAHPNTDWNGAFSRTFTTKQLELLKSEGYEGQFAHLNTPKDLSSVVEKAVKEHLKNQKIDFLIVDAHGTRDEIHLSYPGSGRLPKIWRPESLSESSKVFQYLHENATIILRSCSTGEPPYATSLAGRLSKIAKRTVIAPEQTIIGAISINQIVSSLKMRKPILTPTCQAINSYKNGDINFKTETTHDSLRDCQKRYSKIKQILRGMWTPLMFAAAHQLSAIPVLLQAGANVNAVDKDDDTPLTIASCNQPSAIPLLLQAGAKINAATKDGNTPLMFAAKYQPAAIPVLLQAGAEVNAANKEGDTPLTIASIHQPSAILQLFKARAGPVLSMYYKRFLSNFI